MNIKKRTNQILELLDVTGVAALPKKISQKNTEEENIDNLEGQTKKDLIDTLQKEDVKIYASKKGRNPKKSKKSKNNEKLKVSINKDDDIDNYQSPSNNYKGRESGSNLNFKHSINKKSQNNFRYNNIDELVVYNENPIQSSKDETNKEELDPAKIEYDFNICEVLGASIFKCCQSKELQIKYNLNEKANSILSSKLDIVLYVRNMILFDIMNETLLSVGYKDIMNFLSRPIISLKGKEENVFSIFYHGYKSSDFDKFYNGINDLSQKMNKAREEKELLALTDKHLKSLLV